MGTIGSDVRVMVGVDSARSVIVVINFERDVTVLEFTDQGLYSILGHPW